MDWLPAAVAAVVALPLGWLAARNQHYLYTEPAYRAEPLGGSGGRLLPPFVAIGAAAATLLAFRPNHYDAGPALVAALFAAALLVLASTDFERRRLPNRLTYPAILAAIAVCWAWPDRSAADIALGASVALGIGAALFGLGLLTGAVLGVSATAFGLGDVKLILLLGLLLGWPAVLGALFLGVIVAGIPALAMMLRGRRRQVYSYGPYLAFAGIVAILFPERFL
jgi:leader peptidase (prepilin peptidase)/N-methyltransferase